MEKQENWIGHPTAARRLTDEGVLYLDAENQSLALMLGAFRADEQLFDGANLWEVDRFVEGLEASADSMAPEMRKTLDKVRELGKKGNWPECRLQAKVINAVMREREKVERSDETILASLAELRAALPSQGSAPSESTQVGHSGAMANSRVNRMKARGNKLDHVIAQAKQRAADSNDPHSVWNSLCAMADKADLRTDVLLGLDGDGVKYRRDDGGPGWLNKRAFMARWARATLRNAKSR